ncbi:hypothetical protein P1T45_08445 [Streptococcus parauberis]|uniref:hypothetical protein n=1 Tax=Streptococcus parauberis TaxID=1348 RepID=UPI00055BF70C|nr:hypothetical protein [Streptococcus parauberis]WEM61739.1 hypothetical protein P1T46_01770 [Streptococcus parauberis]WEM64643.1 hypothetical protein P1T45_08445 [Streptococcus parauberis]
MKNKDYIDTKELESLDDLTVRYNKLIKPSTISKLNNKVKKAFQNKLRDLFIELGVIYQKIIFTNLHLILLVLDIRKLRNKQFASQSVKVQY